MRAPCDYCNGWFPKTFSALKVIMVAVVENKSKVKYVYKSKMKVITSCDSHGTSMIFKTETVQLNGT